MWLILCSSG
uniref:Uncharacterized protein n=1 Tax=Arundo donax TaxID=35708 RepID=A0A0A9EEA6_ARUDO